ncbi:hypothetical protein HDU93_004394, partial [Gonapodya sp. JEL0774]
MPIQIKSGIDSTIFKSYADGPLTSGALCKDFGLRDSIKATVLVPDTDPDLMYFPNDDGVFEVPLISGYTIVGEDSCKGAVRSATGLDLIDWNSQPRQAPGLDNDSFSVSSGVTDLTEISVSDAESEIPQSLSATHPAIVRSPADIIFSPEEEAMVQNYLKEKDNLRNLLVNNVNPPELAGNANKQKRTDFRRK